MTTTTFPTLRGSSQRIAVPTPPRLVDFGGEIPEKEPALPPLSYRMTDADPLPQEPAFCRKRLRFVVQNHLSRPKADKKTRQTILDLAQSLIDEPVPGISDLFSVETGGGEIIGHFEPLPGHQLEKSIQQLRGLPPRIWIEVAQQLLETAIRVHQRGGIEIIFDPKRIFVWRLGDDTLAGFSGCEFHTGAEQESTEWAHWLRQLAIIWQYMATGEWMPQYYSLVGRNSDDAAPQLRDCPPILRFLDRLFAVDYHNRLFTVEDIREALEQCADEVRSLEIPAAALRFFDDIPRERRCLAWMPAKEQMPLGYDLTANGSDPRRPTVLPTIERSSQKSVFLHTLPPDEVTGGALSTFHRQLDYLRGETDCKLPILPLVGDWRIGGARVYAEKAPRGFSLEHLLKRCPDGLSMALAKPLIQAVHKTLSAVDKHGIKVPSLNPANIFVVPAARSWPLTEKTGNFDWLADPAAYQIQVRAIPTAFLHRRDPAHLRYTSGRIVRFPEGARFAELVSRLLSLDQLKSPKTAMAISRAIERGREDCDGAGLRKIFLDELSGKTGKQKAIRPLPGMRGKALMASAASIMLGFGFAIGIASAIKSSNEHESLSANPNRGETEAVPDSATQ